MQVSNAAASSTLTQTGASGSTASNSPPVSATSDATTTSVGSSAASPSQDSAVTISPEGAAIAAQDASSTQSNASNSDDSGGTTDVSPLKSLTYGTLGLERPDQSQDNRNPFYTAGRWLAAGLTIGGIISLLI